MKRNRKKYDFIFKEKAVLLSYERNSLAKLEKELCLYCGALSKWRREYEKFNKDGIIGNQYLKLSLEQQRIEELEKKIKKSDLKFEILKSAGEYLHQGAAMIFYFMANNEKKYSIRLMCEVLSINRGTYRGWKNQIITERQKTKILIQKEITTMFFAFKQRYGSKRITIELQNSGYQISCWTVNNYMKELGLTNKVKKN